MDDPLKNLAASMGIVIQPKTVFVEGDTDIRLFELAAKLDGIVTGFDLLDGLAIVSAGTGDEGGTRGVTAKMIAFNLMGRTVLLPSGRKRYRFVALLDNDAAGRAAVKEIQSLNPGLVPYRDMFLLHPVFPVTTNLDPPGLGREFDRENQDWRGLDWELEDLISPSLLEVFLQDHPGAIRKVVEKGGKRHTKLEDHAKGSFHKFVRDNAIRDDLMDVIKALRALRTYLLLPLPGP